MGQKDTPATIPTFGIVRRFVGHGIVPGSGRLPAHDGRNRLGETVAIDPDLPESQYQLEAPRSPSPTGFHPWRFLHIGSVSPSPIDKSAALPNVQTQGPRLSFRGVKAARA
jgi:hypothetical protein